MSFAGAPYTSVVEVWDLSTSSSSMPPPSAVGCDAFLAVRLAMVAYSTCRREGGGDARSILSAYRNSIETVDYSPCVLARI